MKGLFKKDYLLYYLLVSGFVSLFFIAELVNNRFWLNDFKVYYYASSDFINGYSMYEHTYGLGSGWFKYSPFFALVFSFFTLFYYHFASILFYWIISLSILIYLPKFQDLININSRYNNILLILLFVFIADHLVRELHLGNVNFILLILAYGVYQSFKEGKTILPAVLFAIIVLLKPYFLILGLFFLLHKSYKIIVYSAVLIGILALLPSVFIGFNSNLSLLKEWGVAMSNHNQEITSYNYLAGTIKLYFGLDISIFVFIGLFSVVYVVSFFKFLQENTFISFFILLAVVPNLVLTDTEHFLYSIPLILYFLNQLRGKVSLINVLGFGGLILYGLNWGFVWGSKVGEMKISGLIGLGNLVLISVIMIIVYRETQLSPQKKASTNESLL